MVDNKNFGRTISVVVGNPGEEGIEIGGANDNNAIPLHVSFSFSRDDFVTLNQGSVTIWNLNQKHLDLLNIVDIQLELRAGYNGKMAKMFSGTVYCVETQKDGADMRTDIKVVDSLVEAQDTYVSLEYQGGVTWKQVVKDVSKQIGWAVEYSPHAETDTSTISDVGFSFVGKAKDILMKMCESTDLEYSIQNGVLQIKYHGDEMNGSCYELNAMTGLIGAPYKKMLKKEEQTQYMEFGYEVEFFLNGQIQVGDKVHLSSRFFYDYFVVSTIDYSGDNLSSDWKCSATLIAPNGQMAQDLYESKQEAANSTE